MGGRAGGKEKESEGWDKRRGGGGGGEEERIGVKGGERERGRRELTCTSGISCLWRYTVDC